MIFGSSRARPLKEVKKEYERELVRARRGSRKGGERKMQGRLERLQWDLAMARYYDDCVDLSARLARWARAMGPGRRFVVTSGGGPGIMEAANRGATERAGWISAGFGIDIPVEEHANRYITPELSTLFHYFFMRKFWFIYLAAGVIIFPGGFGTMDEFFEVLTLLHTRKISRPLPVVLYGRRYWNDVVNFDAMVRWGVIDRDALKLFRFCDTPAEAFEYLKGELLKHYRRPPPRVAP